MSFSSVGIGAVIDALTGAQGAGPDPVSEDELAPTLNNISVALQIISDTFDALNEASQDAVTTATDVATKVEGIGQDVSDVLDRLIDTIIPHSLSWLDGYIVSSYIDPINDRIDALTSRVESLEDRVSTLESWRSDKADPILDNYQAWRQWFDTWPQGILFRWHDWFAKPEGFVDWVGDMLVGPTVSYLGDKDHRETRDNLAEIMVKAWTERSTPIWIELLEWFDGKVN